ncbi:MAG: thiamine diphosphokinase [Bacillota bacterium]
MNKTADIILNGVRLDTAVNGDYVICADGGYNLYNGTPNCIIGDLDSINEVPKDVDLIKFPTDKDYTDGELAVRHAIKLGYKNLTIHCALLGRIDHILSNITLLQVAHNLGASAQIVDTNVTINYYEKGTHTIGAEAEDTVSILPINGSATISESFGLQYPLQHLTLTPPTTTGQSNKALTNNPTIKISSGAVLIIVST